MEAQLNKKLLRYIGPGKVFVFSTSYCPYCVKAKNLLKENEIKYDTVEVDTDPDLGDDEEFIQALEKHSKISTYPKVYIGMVCIGGFTDLNKLYTTMMLFSMLKKEGISFKNEDKFNSKY
jgi:glutaredoxin